MVTDELWAAATGRAGADSLCIGCLEDRLDMALTPVDFPRLPLNDDDEKDSVRLRVRKGSGRKTEALYPVAMAAVLQAGAHVAAIAAALGLDEGLLHRRLGTRREPEAEMADVKRQGI